MLPDVSRTFHGRDVFAPASAHLAKGTPPARFGKVVHDFVRNASLAPMQSHPRIWTGRVLKVDRFGNLITNFHIDRLPELCTRPFELRAGGQTVARLALNYAEMQIGEVFTIIGSSGYLEISSNQNSAARQLGCSVGATIELEIFGS